MSTIEMLDTWGQRLDEAKSKLDDLDPLARTAAKEYGDALNEVTRAGLELIIKELKAHSSTKEYLYTLVDYPQVRMLFAMHGLIRLPDVEESIDHDQPAANQGGAVFAATDLFNKPNPDAANAAAGGGCGSGSCGCG